jgi:hypothetical protein
MTEVGDRSRSRAILIGASRFDHLPELPAVRNNLQALRTALTDAVHGILAPANCEIVDGPETPGIFMKRLKRVISQTDGLLLVYYAGHGVRHDITGKLYLAVQQSERDELNGSAVPFDWIRDELEHSPAVTNWLVLDCCYSGMAIGAMSGGSAVDSHEMVVQGTAAMASSPRNEISHSPPGRRYTAFTGEMISLLENGSPISGERLTVNTLYRRISTALVRDALPKPLLKVTNTSGDLLVRHEAPVPTEPVVSPPTPRSLPDGPLSVEPSTPEQAETSTPVPAQVTPPADGESVPPEVSLQPAQPLRPAATAAPKGRRSARVKVQVLRLLSTLLGLFAAMGLSSLIGVLFGDHSAANSAGTDRGYAVMGFVLAVIIGVPLLWLQRRWGGAPGGPPPPPHKKKKKKTPPKNK